MKKFTPNIHRHWAELYAEGFSSNQIADQYGTIPGVVLYWLRNLKVPIRVFRAPVHRGPTQGEMMYLEKAANPELGWNEVGHRILGRPAINDTGKRACTIARYWALRNGRKWPLVNSNMTKRYTDRDRQRWIRLYRKGISTGKISKQEGVSRQSVSTALKAAGVPMVTPSERAKARKRKVSKAVLRLEHKAWRLRIEENLSWNEVAELLWNGNDFQPKNPSASAFKAATRHCARNSIPWPPEKRFYGRNFHLGEDAYRMKSETDLTWHQIGNRLGCFEHLHPGLAAKRAASQHAKENGLAWPVPVPQKR